MRRRQEAREAVLNVNAVQSQMIEQQRCIRVLAMDVEEEPAREGLHLRLQAVLLEQLVEVGRELRGALLHLLLHLRSLGLDVIQHSPGGCEYQRMANERAREERHAHFREGVVTESPRTPVQRIHEFAITGEN